MKFLALALLLTTAVFAQEAKPTLVQPGKLIAAPDLKGPLPEEWAVQKGTWDVKDGEVVVSDIPEQHHGPVLWHKVSLASAIVECEFKFDGAGSFILGSDSNKHIGRLSINKKGMKLQEDSSEVKGVRPGGTVAEATANGTRCATSGAATRCPPPSVTNPLRARTRPTRKSAPAGGLPQVAPSWRSAT